MLIRVWRDRYRELGRRENIRYVLIFENRGAEVGLPCTIPRPDLCLSLYPARTGRELQSAREHRAQTGAASIAIPGRGAGGGPPLVSVNEAFGRFCSFHRPLPIRGAPLCPPPPGFPGGTLPPGDFPAGRDAAAAGAQLRPPLRPSFPVHNGAAPGTHGAPGRLGHLHFEFLPPLRDRGKLKFSGRLRAGAGTFINDSMPEEKAILLRAAWDKEDQSC